MLRTDRSLLDRCIRGDSAAQFQLFDQVFDTLMSVARRYEQDDQQRKVIVNNAYMKILDNLHTWQATGPFQAWCRRIAVNTALNDLRDRKVTSSHEVDLDEHVLDHHPQVHNEALERMEVETLQQLLDKLPPTTRHVFNLYAIDGWKHREIAVELGISEGTSKWHMHAARQQLQHMIGALHGRRVKAHSA